MSMYFSGVSTRQVDATGEQLWGDRMPPHSLSDDLKRVYKGIDAWRNRPLGRAFPYVFMDGIWIKRSWGGSIENVSVLVAIGVAEGMKEDAAPAGSRSSAASSPAVWPACAWPWTTATPGSSTPSASCCPGRLPAVHGPLRAQRPRQGAEKGTQARRRQAQGHIRAMEDRDRTLAKAESVATETGRHEAERGRQMPARGHRRGDDLPAAGIPVGALEADPHEQHDRTPRPQDTPQDRSSDSSPTGRAPSCSSPRESAMSPRTDRTAATWTCHCSSR